MTKLQNYRITELQNYRIFKVKQLFILKNNYRKEALCSRMKKEE